MGQGEGVVAGEDPDGSGWRAISAVEQLRRRAKDVLDPVHYDYFAGGAGEEVVLGENPRAYDRLALRPRILRGSAKRDLSVELPGARASMPIFVSPTAFHKLAHPDGELATARAVAAAGTVLISSMAASVPIAEVTAAAREVDRDAAVWFQLYLQNSREVTACLVRRAEEAGCSAFMVTVDSPVFARRARERTYPFNDLPPHIAAENMRDLPGCEPGALRDVEMSPEVSWEYVAWLRERTSLPVLLKGVLHPDDAVLAVDAGVDGLLVSNHGGRQFDAAPAAAEALPSIVDAVEGGIPVLVDGGVRRGGDVAKALALGARAVGVGRPVLWGLAADGENGAREVLEALRAEFDHALTLCGGRDLADLTRDLVVVRGSGAAW